MQLEFSKPCSKCRTLFPLWEYGRKQSSEDGRRSECRICRSDQQRVRIQLIKADPERYAALKSKWAASAKMRYLAGIRYGTKEKLRARGIVHDMLRDGRLLRQKCEKCDLPGEAHHPDYNKPKEVRWLCRGHHSREHALELRRSRLQAAVA